MWIVTGIIILVNLLTYLWVKGKALLYVSDLLPVVCAFLSLLGVLSAFRGFKTFDLAKIAWFLIFIGLLFNFIAESTYGFMEIVVQTDMNETFPTMADLFWCAAYLAFFSGLALMIVGYRRSGMPLGKLKTNIGLSLFFVIVSIIVIIFLCIPVISDDETDAFSKVVYLWYPIGDVLVVSMALMLISMMSQFGIGKISLPWILLASGFLFFTISDLLYSYLGWQELYHNGNLIDLGWNVGYLLIGLAGLYQRQLVESIQKKK